MGGMHDDCSSTCVCPRTASPLAGVELGTAVTGISTLYMPLGVCAFEFRLRLVGRTKLLVVILNLTRNTATRRL